jgi:disulfide bond formation protein DsbB
MRAMKLSQRSAYAVAAAACAALLGYGFYLQYAQGLEPCPLCLVQRGFFMAVMALFAVAALHAPRRAGGFVYAALIVLFAAGGAATAGRQVWLQHLPADKVPQCGPDLYFMLQNFPLASTLEKLIRGSGECAAVDWKFLGLSIAGWSLVWFVALAAYAVWLAVRRPAAAAPPPQAAAAASR